MPQKSGRKNRNTTRKRAVALSYSKADELPQVVANGAGEVASQILKLAERYNIPIHEDQGLARLLGELQVGTSVSSETFQAVAEIMTFLYFVDKEWREQHPFLEGVVGESATACTD